MSQKYSVNQYQISSILDWVKTGQIAIPEIQRPFVWETTKIRDLIDSLYQGYPIGYIITWQNQDVRLKDGSTAFGKKILIDGQQRVTAMQASIVGQKIVNKEYKEVRVRISFNPLTEDFRTRTAVTSKEPEWIEDISEIMKDDASLFEIVSAYMARNPAADQKKIEQNIQKLINVKTKQIGMIELDASLDIETVTEIFIRINSQGVVLSQADFAMSKIAAYGEFGVNLRKTIDYFCHFAIAPHFFKMVAENDQEYAKTDYIHKIEWLKNENDDLFDPDYNDLMRTITIHEFKRGRVADLVSLLSGRDFETREYKPEIAEDSFNRLEKAILQYVNETNFKRFLMILKSAGYISKDMITAKNALNFAYALFLKLRDDGERPEVIESVVRRWFVMSMLTGRHSGSFESVFESDIRKIDEQGAKQYLASIEEGELSDAFWSVRLVQELEKSSIRNPYINAFFAAQVYFEDKGLLSKDIKVRDMIEHAGDIHHIFPKRYMIKNGYDRWTYNQVANYVQAQTEINIAISSKEPKQYMHDVLAQCNGGKKKYGNIDNMAELNKNLQANAIPQLIFDATYKDFEPFLSERRRLMATKIEKYYKSL
ncbi:DUF262 domain-containing protein [Candidatus Saccharibacteria bacterium]|nr:DUF262 domain-containing protein [Candidatus Saccharibacteria bacterium]